MTIQLDMPGSSHGIKLSIFFAIVAAALTAGACWACARVGTTHAALAAAIFAAGGIFAIVLCSGVLIARRWAAPASLLSNTAAQVAGGNWSARFPAENMHELAALATQLNMIVEAGRQQISELAQQRADLGSLIDSMPDPIILTDSQQRIVRMNRPAATFFSITLPRARGEKLISILGESTLVDMYEKLLADRSAAPLTCEMRVTRLGQRMTYHVVVAWTAVGGMLLLLRDVSRLAAAVQMKTDFVANASHELRTPITAIKIAFETLADVYTDDLPQAARCIAIIDGHLHRLEELLRDLLDLSRVETVDIKPEFSELNARDALSRVTEAMSSLAASKSLDLAIEGDLEMTFLSDFRLFDLAVKNLVENSIKYTPAGGIVRVRLRRHAGEKGTERMLVLSVSDTGIGIPPQHIERVFERFYQVDAARSGSSGRGTGLGLAIVKHAMHALGGQVKIESIVGRGTAVTCTFPEFPTAPTLFDSREASVAAGE